MMSQVISYRESAKNIEALDRLCAATERDRAYHLRRAIAAYLHANSWRTANLSETVLATKEMIS